MHCRRPPRPRPRQTKGLAAARARSRSKPPYPRPLTRTRLAWSALRGAHPVWASWSPPGLPLLRPVGRRKQEHTVHTVPSLVQINAPCAFICRKIGFEPSRPDHVIVIASARWGRRRCGPASTRTRRTGDRSTAREASSAEWQRATRTVSGAGTTHCSVPAPALTRLAVTHARHRMHARARTHARALSLSYPLTRTLAHSHTRTLAHSHTQKGGGVQAKGP